jgi:hypothetical protein
MSWPEAAVYIAAFLSVAIVLHPIAFVAAARFWGDDK